MLTAWDDKQVIFTKVSYNGALLPPAAFQAKDHPTNHHRRPSKNHPHSSSVYYGLFTFSE